MINELQQIAVLAIFFLLLFGIAEILLHKFSIQAEVTRKIVHIGTGFITLLFPVFLNNHWSVFLLCSGFLLLLILSLRFNFLKSINAIKRTSYGSLLYPVSVYLCFYMYVVSDNQIVFFYLPILVLALCDPLAALVGKKMAFGKYVKGKKCLAGSLAFFLLCMGISFYFLFGWVELGLLKGILFSALLAIVLSITEAFSSKGFDNLSVPVIALLVLKILI